MKENNGMRMRYRPQTSRHHQRQAIRIAMPITSKDETAGAGALGFHRALPPRPVGLKASVSSSRANTTINPESAPTY